MVVKQSRSIALQQIAENPKVAAVASAGAGAVGVSSTFDVVSSTLGIVASILAIALTITLIFVHLRKSKNESKKAEIEIELLKRKKRYYEDKGGPK